MGLFGCLPAFEQVQSWVGLCHVGCPGREFRIQWRRLMLSPHFSQAQSSSSSTQFCSLPVLKRGKTCCSVQPLYSTASSPGPVNTLYRIPRAGSTHIPPAMSPLGLDSQLQNTWLCSNSQEKSSTEFGINLCSPGLHLLTCTDLMHIFHPMITPKLSIPGDRVRHGNIWRHMSAEHEIIRYGTESMHNWCPVQTCSAFQHAMTWYNGSPANISNNFPGQTHNQHINQVCSGFCVDGFPAKWFHQVYHLDTIKAP